MLLKGFEYCFHKAQLKKVHYTALNRVLDNITFKEL